MLSVGVDSEVIADMQKKALLKSKAFFNDNELNYCEERVDSLTGLVCIKESCIKALSSLDNVPFYTYKDIELCHEKSGRPYLLFHGRLKEYLDESACKTTISITHNTSIATAIVIIYQGF